MINKKNIDKTIVCPKCGTHYLPAEVFIPDEFFGHPQRIERGDDGKILDFVGNTLDLEESFTCENCNTIFYVNTEIKFITHLEDTTDFDCSHATPLHYKVSLFSDDVSE